ncbi:glutathione S-transferase family protein [Sphingosinicella terrae]|uniref:glutathione S-transferase family protein n=1 Tax=Sphingosinicella terrae TaxID=2172047 RepID=UPI000E0D86B9
MTLHAHPLSSYCWKVLIPLYENGTPFDFRQVGPMDEIAALWPIAKMPVLEDDGRVVAESSIIIEYLDLHHPGHVRFVPAEPEAALETRMLDRVFDSYVMTPLQRIVGNRIRPADRRDPLAGEESRSLLDRSYAWLETKLADRRWAAGDDFGLADCAAAPSLHYAEKVHPRGDRFPALDAYVGRLRARPSFARVLEEAAPYAHMFPEGD